jgi:hypothetical protein
MPFRAYFFSVYFNGLLHVINANIYGRWVRLDLQEKKNFLPGHFFHSIGGCVAHLQVLSFMQKVSNSIANKSKKADTMIPLLYDFADLLIQ